MSYLDPPQTQKANRKFVRAAMSIPLLEREHEQNLARRWRIYLIGNRRSSANGG